MRKERDDSLNEVRDLVGQRLDWNLRDAELTAWRVNHGRLQVILIDRCPRGAEDTREYMECVTELAKKEKIDIIVLHENA